jgi:hypothetical protein
MSTRTLEALLLVTLAVMFTAAPALADDGDAAAFVVNPPDVSGAACVDCGNGDSHTTASAATLAQARRTATPRREAACIEPLFLPVCRGLLTRS